MDSSYTNPYGAQPSIPDGGQENNAWPPVSDPSISAAQQQAGYEQAGYVQPSYEQPTYEQQTSYTPQSGFYDNSYSNAQGDIVIAPSKPAGNLGLKRILILAGAGLAVVVLFVAALMSISSGNQAATEAANTERNEKLAVIENLYIDYESFLEDYKKIGVAPSETMQQELDDTNKFFVLKSNTLLALEIMVGVLEEDFSRVDETDFSVLGGTVGNEIKMITTDIKNGFGNMKTNISVLGTFYDAFVTPIEEGLDEETATSQCSFSVTAEDMADLEIDGFDVEDAISKYNQAYCALNDAYYYETFNGKFDSPYIRSAKEALIKALLNTSEQTGNLKNLGKLLTGLGSEKAKAETDVYESIDITTEEEE